MAYSINTDVYRAAGISSNEISTTDVDAMILRADEFIDNYFNTTFETKVHTELKDGTGNAGYFTEYYPIVSVDSLSIDSISVTPSNIYIYSRTGKLILKSNAEVTKFKNNEPQQINLTYTFGYDLDFTTLSNNTGTDRIAYLISDLSAKIAAMNALTSQIGGTFNDVTSYQLPELSASKGEPYTNIRETINKLRESIDSILKSPSLQALTRNIYVG